MHIEFQTPKISKPRAMADSHRVSQKIVQHRMSQWAKDYPNAHYNLAVTETAVLVKFDNPMDTTLWAMTWEAYRDIYNATSWKRIRIVDDTP